MRGLAIDSRYRVVRNLCYNPSAESGTTSGWSVGSGASLVVDSDESHSGTYCFRVTTSGANLSEGISQRTTTANKAPASSGKTTDETISMWVKAPAGAQLFLGVEEYVLDGTYINSRAQTFFVGTDTWQRVSATARKSVASNILRGLIRTAATPQAVTFYVDDALNLDTDIPIDYADGDSPNWRWDGTPGASTSRGRVFVP